MIISNQNNMLVLSPFVLSTKIHLHDFKVSKIATVVSILEKQ
jgi:hypothetical protein